MNIESSKKIEFLEEKGMTTDQLDFDVLEAVYDVVINNQSSEPLKIKNKYKKINWEGDEQLVIFLNMINKFKICKKIKQTSSSIEIQIFSILDKNDNSIIHINPQIILRKIKKRCDLFLTSNIWTTIDFIYHSDEFIEKSKNKYLWTGDISNELDFKNLKNICSMILSDHRALEEELKGLEDGIF